VAAKTVLQWKEDLAFDVELQGHRFMVDADARFGGKNRGPRPKALLLSGLAGCTGMDVASLLAKMRMNFATFKLEVESTDTDEHPKVFKEILIRYIFTGAELDREKIEKAVDLSLSKYCGVHAMLAKTAAIRHEIVLNPPDP
jgi:putative redox protein